MTGRMESHFDVIVIGGGSCGLYATYRFSRDGLSVLAIEGAADVGGVWHHNRYPGARVDLDSLDYSYQFSPELYREWKWTERNSAQPELQKYFSYVADKFDLKRFFLFNTRVVNAQYGAERALWSVRTNTHQTFTCRYLVPAMGNHSAPKDPDLPGLSDFEGEWVTTSRWPDREVTLEGRRIAVIGTGSSGVQAATAVAERAGHLFVFQRTPSFCVPAQNYLLDPKRIESIADNFDAHRASMFKHPSGADMPYSNGPMRKFNETERRQLLEQAWQYGGQSFQMVFDDVATDWDVNHVLQDFVRAKIRSIVNDKAVAESLCPSGYPLGARRLVLDTGFYEIFNRSNVSLVDTRHSPIEKITETGIHTTDRHYEVDLIIFALGFRLFTGPLIDANIRNDRGETVTDLWKPGPKTLLGLMSNGFPNLFTPAGPGSLAVAVNIIPFNELQIDWIADCIAYVDRNGYRTIEPKVEAQEAWTKHVAEVAGRTLRMKLDQPNWYVHVDPDSGTRVCMPYLGGLPAYLARCEEATANGYQSFVLR